MPHVLPNLSSSNRTCWLTAAGFDLSSDAAPERLEWRAAMVGCPTIRFAPILMSEPRDHHYVPVFYLSRWADADGTLSVYAREGGRIVVSRRNPRSTGFERELYSLAAVVLRSGNLSRRSSSRGRSISEWPTIRARPRRGVPGRG